METSCGLMGNDVVRVFLPIIKLRCKLDYQKKDFNAFRVLSESIYVTNGAEMSFYCRVQHRNASIDPLAPLELLQSPASLFVECIFTS